MPVARRVRQMFQLAKQGDLAMLGADAKRWIHSDTESLGFRRDYSIPVAQPPEPVLDLRIEPLDQSLADKLFDEPEVTGQNQLYLQRRRAMWDLGFRGGYVALDQNDQPAYLQFYIPHEQSDLVRRHWGGLFPDFGPDTLLVEGAWVPPAFRGRRVMAQGMYLTSEAAKSASPPSVRFAETYVDVGNRGAKIGCLDAGFEVFQRRTESWRLGRHTFRFEQHVEALA